MTWTDQHTTLYRAEVERRFRARTPVEDGDVYSVLWEDRVVRSEMRGWCLEQIGILPPEVDRDWVKAQALWYRAMARRVMKAQDPDMYRHYFTERRARPSPIW
jgi:hypothetical protein